jgi:hypothetical protein
MRGFNIPILALVSGLALTVSGCGQRLAVDAAEKAVAAESAQPPAEEEAMPSKPVLSSDRGGALLMELLAPSSQTLLNLDSDRPRQRPLPPLSEPVLPLPASTAPVPHLPVEVSRKPLRPADIADALPFSDQSGRPPLPEKPLLPTTAPVLVPSPDVNQPVPLPILAKPISSSVPQDDPTAGASLSLALAISPPLRATPAAFIRFALPDPFEHRAAGRLRNPPEENSTPVTAAPRPPSKP